MKSLVEEASTIAKAIEKAWIAAEKPQSFSIKVFEHPESNFLGFVKKSAKVGIFFEPVSPIAQRPGERNYAKPEYKTSQRSTNHTGNSRTERSGDRTGDRTHERSSTRSSTPRHTQAHPQRNMPKSHNVTDTTKEKEESRGETRYQEKQPRMPHKPKDLATQGHHRQRQLEFQEEQRAQTTRDEVRESVKHAQTQNSTQHHQQVRESQNKHEQASAPARTQTHTQAQTETRTQPNTGTAPAIASIARAPIRKVLKVSSRCYSSQNQHTKQSQTHQIHAAQNTNSDTGTELSNNACDKTKK